MRAVTALLLSASACQAALVAACDDPAQDAREDQIVAVLVQADESMIRTRPALAEGKYARMTSSPIAFLRGSLPLYRHDMRAGTSSLAVSRFSLEVPLVPCLGDPHLENFGALRARDGSIALEPNDFDAADRAPYLWDVRRLATSVALTALVSGADAATARAVTYATVMAYRRGIERAALAVPPVRYTAQALGSSPIVDDVFDRSERDQALRRELAVLTELDGGARRFRRGVIDPEDPQGVLLDVPKPAYAALPAAIEAWRSSLVAPLPVEHLVLLDAARILGSGVASWPRIRLLLLVRGATDAPDDDLVLELKELADSGIGGLYPPGVHHDDVGLRVIESARAAWARPDGEPLWGVTRWLGLPSQIRAESEGQKNVRVSRMVGKRGTPEALTRIGEATASIVARVHTSGPDGLANARAVYARIAVDPAQFVDEQTDVALGYATSTRDDHARFVRALARRGGALGVPLDASDGPRPDVAAVLGTPPPPPPLP